MTGTLTKQAENLYRYQVFRVRFFLSGDSMQTDYSLACNKVSMVPVSRVSA